MRYFDYAAATPLAPEVRLAMEPYLTDIFANPASVHQPGQLARRALEQAREQVRVLIGATKPTEIIFTASATESNNLVLRGLALARSRTNQSPAHFIASTIEHPSVLEPLHDLERLKLATVTLIPPLSSGLVPPEAIQRAVCPETALISLHLVNSEIGTIQAVAELSTALRRLNLNQSEPILLHTDAAQAPLTESVLIKELGVDFLTLSAHKIYGPRGVALLFVRDGVELEPLLSGGEQEFGRRAGTENIAAIVGLAEALTLAITQREQAKNFFTRIRQKFLETLQRRQVVFELNGDRATARIVNLYFPWIKAAELLIGLDQNGFAISAGSACRARAVVPSPVVAALNRDRARAHHSSRISFGRATTEAEATELAAAIAALQLRYNTI